MNQAATAGLQAFRPRVLHTAYHVEDIDRATAFYVGLLGMHEQMRFPLPHGEWECVLNFVDGEGKPAGSGVVLMWTPDTPKAVNHAAGYSRLVIKVSNVDAAVEQLKEAGVRITMAPTDTPLNLRFAMCEDPDGYTVELLQIGPAR